MNIHIETVGDRYEHVENAYMRLPIDKIYFITSKEYKDKAIEKKTEFSNKGIEVTVHVIHDAFSNEGAIEIINYIKEITDQHPNDDIFVNITGGTNLMAAMALLGALYAGSKNIYYVLDPSKVDKKKEVILKFQLPRMRSVLSNKQEEVFLGIGEYILEGKRKIKNRDEIKKYKDSTNSIIEIARYVYESDDPGISQRIKPHIDALESMNYIRLEKDGQNKRYQIIELTDAGRILYCQMKMDNKSIKKK